MLGRWEHYKHGIDVGVRGLGATKAEAYAQAALAVTAALADLRAVRPLDSIRLDCAAPDEELLLLEFLNAVLREMAARRMLFCEFRVQLHDGRLSAEARGERLDPRRHRPGEGVKRASFATLRVARHGDGWLAQATLIRAAGARASAMDENERTA